MTIQITPTGVVVKGNLEYLRKEFDRNHCVLLPKFLDPALLKPIQSQIVRSRFFRVKQKDGTSIESRMMRNPTLALLQFLTNDPWLFKRVENITGCKQTEYFDGRVYRFVPGEGHRHFWHDDDVHGRMIAMSINLSTDIYSGGILQIRDSKTKKIYHKVANVGFGDAILFRIHDRLEHRLTAITGTMAKVSYAGWFRSRLNYQSFLRKKLVQLNENSHGDVKIETNGGNQQSVRLNGRVSLGQNLVYRILGEDMFIFDVERGLFYKLDSIGTRLWSAILKNGRLQNILALMKSEYDADPKILKRDILDLVQRLHQQGLVNLWNGAA